MMAWLKSPENNRNPPKFCLSLNVPHAVLTGRRGTLKMKLNLRCSHQQRCLPAAHTLRPQGTHLHFEVLFEAGTEMWEDTSTTRKMRAGRHLSVSPSSSHHGFYLPPDKGGTSVTPTTPRGGLRAADGESTVGFWPDSPSSRSLAAPVTRYQRCSFSVCSAQFVLVFVSFWLHHTLMPSLFLLIVFSWWTGLMFRASKNTQFGIFCLKPHFSGF